MSDPESTGSTSLTIVIPAYNEAERVGSTLDRIGDFIRFFNGIGGDAVEILFDIPRASGLRVTQAAHDFQQAFDPGVAIVDQRIISCLGHCSPHVSDVRCNLTNIPTGVQ